MTESIGTARPFDWLLLLALPVDLICESILSHLSVRDLQALDTAFTNKLHRPQLREIWKSFRWKRLHIALSMAELKFLLAKCVRLVEIHIEKLQLATASAYDNVDLDNIQCCMTLVPCSVVNVSFTSLIQNCPHLVAICVSRCDIITDAVVQLICDNCPHLQHISIDMFNILTDASLCIIGSTYPQLRFLRMQFCNFTDDGLISFADKCHELRSVSVGGRKITRRGLTALWAANPNLTDVDLSVNAFISDGDVSMLLEHCGNLTALCLAGCAEVTNAAVIAVAEHCPRLTSIKMNYCDNISDASLIALGQHCHKLKSIDLSYIEIISDEGIAALASGCPLLQELHAEHTNISNISIIALANACPALCSVNVGYCMSVDRFTIISLAEKCPLIAELYLNNTGASDACLYAIVQHCRNLSVLDIRYTSCSEGAVALVFSSCRLLRTLVIHRYVMSDEMKTCINKQYSNILLEADV